VKMGGEWLLGDVSVDLCEGVDIGGIGGVGGVFNLASNKLIGGLNKSQSCILIGFADMGQSPISEQQLEVGVEVDVVWVQPSHHHPFLVELQYRLS